MHPTPPQPTPPDVPPLPLRQVLRATDLPLGDVYAAVTHASPAEVRRVYSTLHLGLMLGPSAPGEPPLPMATDDAGRRETLRALASRLHASRLYPALQALRNGPDGLDPHTGFCIHFAITYLRPGPRLGCSGYLTGNTSDRVALMEALLIWHFCNVEPSGQPAGVSTLIARVCEFALASERNPDHQRQAVAMAEQTPGYADRRWNEEQTYLARLRRGAVGMPDPRDPDAPGMLKPPTPLYDELYSFTPHWP